ncbi:anchored repeat-type ABC transporter permease subunit [Thermobispora bispora]|uniref:ABC-3 protein n=1 Tax=Thermobispora bispora (strain ATCC 19993 / DSM 43833 / CBS 139.67 / JCM 10125 / KCTC 9307 / NBRC 14880 / R51) TaxID=469371 RepID=D6Y448_THEBD|nr:metal ABC transporter permease [Thermobispora bispora]MBO2475853.1 metal ABC transporter permease [Actinomycetales bacterium]MDI9580468.1 metal ABC transporter permease [Thermobispora sp.]ADG87102.1 ABC-3 protein [Thermobispora bispora DSM 43833]MBX6166718.1 metal ABC transporter permease [Thermobispora bispora]QSI47072.1 metal ABC transporter permease [Thermobispora bispora]
MSLIEPFQTPFMARALAELIILGVLGGTVGVVVLLRRLAFLSDALSHTIFPGVVAGYLLAGEDGVFWGALAAGIATAALLTLLTRRVAQDAALALLLTTLFAAGVVLVSRRSGYASDLTAFLFGRVLTVTPEQLWQTAAVAAVVIALLAALRRPLLLRAFDPVGAEAAGVRVGLLDLVVNVAVALTVVAAVRAVGMVLVIALLIVPAAAARVLSDRLTVIVPLACLIGAAGGWLGLVVSWEASIGYGLRLASGGTVVLVLVAMYGLAQAAGLVRRRVRLGRARTGLEAVQ